jgi:hypothetical protein
VSLSVRPAGAAWITFPHKVKLVMARR